MTRKTTIKTVYKGEFGHIYPLTVVYQVGKKTIFWQKMKAVII